MRARATTDGAGKQLIMGELSSHLKADGIGRRRKDPWSYLISSYRCAKLGELLSINNGAFHLLATHLIYELGNSAVVECLYGKKGTMSSVKLSGSEYRANAYSIFGKR